MKLLFRMLGCLFFLKGYFFFYHVGNLRAEIESGDKGIRCDRIYKDIQKHDDFCYLSLKPKELRQ